MSKLKFTISSLCVSDQTVQIQLLLLSLCWFLVEFRSGKKHKTRHDSILFRMSTSRTWCLQTSSQTGFWTIRWKCLACFQSKTWFMCHHASLSSTPVFKTCLVGAYLYLWLAVHKNEGCVGMDWLFFFHFWESWLVTGNRQVYRHTTYIGVGF